MYGWQIYAHLTKDGQTFDDNQVPTICARYTKYQGWRMKIIKIQSWKCQRLLKVLLMANFKGGQCQLFVQVGSGQVEVTAERFISCWHSQHWGSASDLNFETEWKCFSRFFLYFCNVSALSGPGVRDYVVRIKRKQMNFVCYRRIIMQCILGTLFAVISRHPCTDTFPL